MTRGPGWWASYWQSKETVVLASVAMFGQGQPVDPDPAREQSAVARAALAEEIARRLDAAAVAVHLTTAPQHHTCIGGPR